MKKITQITLLVFLLLVTSSIVFADECSDFCESEGFATGECRAATEDAICEDGETAYGFDECSVEFERCCCSGEAETTEESTENTTDEEPTVEESTDSGVSLWSSLQTTCQKSSAELLFWVLLIVVVILGVANFLTPKKPKEIDFDEEE